MLRGRKDDAGEPVMQSKFIIVFLVQLKISAMLKIVDVSYTICTVLPGNIACKVG